MGELGATMAKPKTSAEIAREEAENNQLENMLGGAFGDISELEQQPEEETEPVQTNDEAQGEGQTAVDETSEDSPQPSTSDD